MEFVLAGSMTPALLCALSAFLIFAVTSVWLVLVDIREHRLPNRLVSWGTGLVLALLVLSSVFADAEQADDQPWGKLLTSGIAGGLYGLIFFTLWFFSPRSVGAGDVKLAPLIGIIAGWSGLWVAALWVPLLIGALGGIAGLVAHAKRRDFFAFGPVLIGACWVGVLLAGLGWIR